MLLEQRGPGNDVGGDEVAIRPQVPLIEEELASPFDDQAAGL